MPVIAAAAVVAIGLSVAVAGPGDYTAYTALNCYAGHGATNIDDAGNYTIEDPNGNLMPRLIDPSAKRMESYGFKSQCDYLNWKKIP